MKQFALAAVLLWQIGAHNSEIKQPEPQYFGYQRSVVPAGAGVSCSVIDADTFAHAGTSLKDLRLYPRTSGARDIPYAITLSEPEQPDTEPASVLNLGMKNGRIVFDLAMPARPYTSVVLDLAGANFIATAAVTGIKEAGDSAGTQLGDFTLFDLSAQHLSRSTTIGLVESSFPYLHVELNVSPAPGTPASRFAPERVLGARVPPSREAQSIFALAQETAAVREDGRTTVAHFRLPERVPVERISFVLAPEFHGNFSRDITITDHPAGTPSNAGETIDGNIFHVEMTQAGKQIKQQSLSIPATLGSNLQSDAEVEVIIKNGDDRPLPVKAVRLEMRERKLCFSAESDAPLTLFYGDPALTAPQYDFARIFSPDRKVLIARVGTEQKNPIFRARPDERAATERHPELVWIVFLAVVCVLAVIALRSSRHVPR